MIKELKIEVTLDFTDDGITNTEEVVNEVYNAIKYHIINIGLTDIEDESCVKNLKVGVDNYVIDSKGNIF